MRPTKTSSLPCWRPMQSGGGAFQYDDTSLFCRCCPGEYLSNRVRPCDRILIIEAEKRNLGDVMGCQQCRDARKSLRTKDQGEHQILQNPVTQDDPTHPPHSSSNSLSGMITIGDDPEQPSSYQSCTFPTSFSPKTCKAPRKTPRKPKREVQRTRPLDSPKKSLRPAQPVSASNPCHLSWDDLDSLTQAYLQQNHDSALLYVLQRGYQSLATSVPMSLGAQDLRKTKALRKTTLPESTHVSKPHRWRDPSARRQKLLSALHGLRRDNCVKAGEGRVHICAAGGPVSYIEIDLFI